MARIRTVKPELWTDPDFVECSTSARLLFVAALNFASDYGVLPDKPKQLKMQCLPVDDVDIDALIEELIDRRFWYRATAPDGAAVLVIRTFAAHQRVDRPSSGRWGDPKTWTHPDTNSSKAQRTLDESSANTRECSNAEGKGRDLLSAEPAAPGQSRAQRRTRNPMFDALIEACGWSYDDMTPRQRRSTGVALAELVKVNATPVDIIDRARVYGRKFPQAALTPNALASNWASLKPSKAAADTVDINGVTIDRRAFG